MQAKIARQRARPAEVMTSDASLSAEQARLDELAWLRILDTPGEERFDRYSRLVADVFGVATVTITLITADRQWFKSAVGADGINNVPREITFCTHALAVDYLEVPDTHLDPRFAENPVVVGPPYVRFYAGAVLYGPRGRPIGTLCLLDPAPRALDPEEKERLRAFARIVEDEINTARRDERTGLPDDKAAEAQLDWALAASAGAPAAVSVIQLQLCNYDDLVIVADRDTAETVMETLSRRLRRILAPGDILARAACDRFVMAVLGRDPDGPSGADLHLDDWLPVLSRPVATADGSERVSLALGRADHPGHGHSAEALFGTARIALLDAARSGRPGACSLYSAGLHDRVRQHHALLRNLEDALATGQGLSQVYQPFVALADDDQVVAYEALARWHDARQRPIAPDAFIPLCDADEALRTAMTGWSLEQAARFAARLARLGSGPVRRVSVNIPGIELQRPDFVDRLLRRLAGCGARPDQMILELTEQTLIHNIEGAREAMQRLRSQGVLFAIDDFGTGYSSLSYLQNLPVDIVKIDRSFIDRIALDPVAFELARGAINMLHAIQVVVVAEGVEDADQREALRGLGCDQVQGYFIGRPRSAAELLAEVN